MEKNNVKVLVADIGRDQKMEDLLDALGGEGRPIPFYAVYPANGGPPITFDDVPLTQKGLIRHLQRALDTGERETIGQRETVRVAH